MAKEIVEYTSGDSYSNYTISDKISTFGDEDDLWGASEITPAQLKDPSFKILFDAELGEATYRVDSVVVEIFILAPISAAQNAEVFDQYQVGGSYVDTETVWAIADDGIAHLYVASGTGNTSGTLPTFPSFDGETVIDGDITWTEAGQYHPAALPPYHGSALLSGTIGQDANGQRIFVVVGQQGTVKTSYDGEEWTEQQTPVAEALRSVAAGPEGFIAVGDNGVILSSPDAQTWTKEPSETFESFFGVDYDRRNNSFSVAGKDGVIRQKLASASSWNKIQG